MSYRDAIPDIFPGSIWIGLDGCRVTVAQAAARHVAIAGRVMHERDFRAAFEPLYDHARTRQQFTMCLANLGQFRVFWLPAERRIVARSITCSRHFAVPEGALEVGVYSAPCSVSTFFEDLDEIINKGAANGSGKQAAALAAHGG